MSTDNQNTEANAVANAGGAQPRNSRILDAVNASLPRRYGRETRFRYFGLGAVGLGAFFVLLLFATIISDGYSAFTQNFMEIEVELAESTIDPSGDRDPGVLARADYGGIVKTAMRKRFPQVKKRRDKRALYSIVSGGAAFQIQEMVLEDPSLIGTTQKIWVPVDDDVDEYFKGRVSGIKDLRSDGIASPLGTDGKVKILSTSNNFNEVLVDVKKVLDDMAGRAAKSVKALERTREEADAEEKSDYDADIAKAQAEFDDLRQRADTPGGEEMLNSSMPSYFIQINGGLVKVTKVSNSAIEGETLKPLQSEAEAPQGEWQLLEIERPENARRLSDKQIAWLMDIEEQGGVEGRFNSVLFSDGDSREPELAGVGGAVLGSFFTLFVTLALSFPIGVAAAVYLEEFAPKNKWTDLIEVNINNLAAVPSIVFGLLGLAVFINFFGLPRSAPLVGGLVLTLMTLPTIIISSRAAIKSVPPSIRDAALGIGASRMQAMFHHVLPLALPGMLTGTIIGMAQALGETAPLLMIGMVAFIVDIPGGFTDPSTVLPVQIYLWSDLPEKAYEARAAAAIMILLAFLIAMNTLAVVMRRRFERRW